MAVRVTRTTASSGSCTTASGTSATRTFPIPSKTTARTGSGSVRERRVDLTGQLDQNVGRVHVANHGRQVSVDLQLALHHPADRVEFALNDLLPAGVRSPDDVPRRRRAFVIDDPTSPTGSVPQVQVSEDILRHALVRLCLDVEGDVALPVQGGLRVFRGAVDPLDQLLEPGVRREQRHAALTADYSIRTRPGTLRRRPSATGRPGPRSGSRQAD